MELIDTLKDLIEEGEYLVPLGGTNDYNYSLQDRYAAWRIQVIAAVSEVGDSAKLLLKEMEDQVISYFYKDSAGIILGVLKGALGILRRQEKKTTSSPGIAPVGGIGNFDSKVFLVHGHDTALLHQVARLLEQLDIEPIVLFEQPGKGQTIIEKLESNSKVAFAIVIFTPDDVGKALTEDNLKPRARQNVVLELGFFIGRLNRNRVAVLYDESIELPSDYRGVEYIKIDIEAAWKLKLAKEMKAAGLAIDMNKAL